MKYKTPIKIFLIFIGIVFLLYSFWFIFWSNNVAIEESDCNNPVLERGDTEFCKNFNYGERRQEEIRGGIIDGLLGIVLIIGGLLIKKK